MSRMDQNEPKCIRRYNAQLLAADIKDEKLSLIEKNESEWRLKVYSLKYGASDLPERNMLIPEKLSKGGTLHSFVSVPLRMLCPVLSSWLCESQKSGTVWLFGLSDGNVYLLGDDGCDIILGLQQSISCILLYPYSDQPENYNAIVCVGKHGKIGLLSSKDGNVDQHETSLMSSVISCCLDGTNLIYCDSSSSWRLDLNTLHLPQCASKRLKFCGLSAVAASRKKDWGTEVILLSQHGTVYSYKSNYEDTQSENVGPDSANQDNFSPQDALPLSLQDASQVSKKPSEILRQMQSCAEWLQSVNKQRQKQQGFIEQLSLCVTGETMDLSKELTVMAKAVRLEELEQEQIFISLTNNSGFSFKDPFWKIRIGLVSPSKSSFYRVLPLGDLKGGTHYKTSIPLPRGPLPRELGISCALLLCPPSHYVSEVIDGKDQSFQVLFHLNLEDVFLDQLHFLSPAENFVNDVTRCDTQRNQSFSINKRSEEELMMEIARAKPTFHSLKSEEKVVKRKVKSVLSVSRSMSEIQSQELLMLLLNDCEPRGVSVDSKGVVAAKFNDSHVEMKIYEKEQLIVILIEGDDGVLVSEVRKALVKRLRKLELIPQFDSTSLPDTLVTKIKELWSVLEADTEISEDELCKLHGILRSNITAALPIV